MASGANVPSIYVSLIMLINVIIYVIVTTCTSLVTITNMMAGVLMIYFV
jgi:hypothetical protein